MVDRLSNAPRPVVQQPKEQATSAVAQPPAPATPAPPAGWNVNTVTVDGAARRTEMRMPKDAESVAAQGQMPIACPVLKALQVEGKITVDPKGRVKTDEMLAAFREKGMTKPMLETLRSISYFANGPRDIPRNVMDQSFDVMRLRSGLTMHNSDTNILSKGQFDEAAFNKLASHAKDGWMDADSFSAAIATQTSGDIRAQNPLTPLTFGKNAVLSEYGVMLQLFNTKDPSGKPAIKVDDLKAFWKDGTWPAAPGAPGSVGILDSAKLYGSMLLKADAKLVGDAFSGTTTATGMAHQGLRLSGAEEGKVGAGTMAATGAGKAANCPHMSGAGMKPRVEDNLKAHF